MGIWKENLGTIKDSKNDDLVTCAIYGKEHNPLDKPGWTKLRRLATRQGKMIPLIRQAKLRSYQTSPIYKYGFWVPRNHNKAIEVEKKALNGEMQKLPRQINLMNVIH